QHLDCQPSEIVPLLAHVRMMANLEVIRLTTKPRNRSGVRSGSREQDLMHAAFPMITRSIIEACDAELNVAIALAVFERSDPTLINPVVERIDIKCEQFVTGIELEDKIIGGLRSRILARGAEVKEPLTGFELEMLSLPGEPVLYLSRLFSREDNVESIADNLDPASASARDHRRVIDAAGVKHQHLAVAVDELLEMKEQFR